MVRWLVTCATEVGGYPMSISLSVSPVAQTKPAWSVQPVAVADPVHTNTLRWCYSVRLDNDNASIIIVPWNVQGISQAL